MRKHALCWLIVFAIMSALPPRTVAVPLVPSISGINVVVACGTSALINFNTSSASSAFIEYGTTTSYGSATINDTARRYKEHAIPITGLNAGILYHYRIVATDSGGTTTGSDQTLTTSTNNTACPELPIQVDHRMPDMSGAVEETVKVSGGTYTPLQFPIALNVARLASGKRIITVDTLAQGVTLTGPFILGNKIDNNWIVVRSSAHASLTEARRVGGPSDTASLFKITTNNAGADQAPVQTATSAHHWRFIGAEITIEASAMGADAPGGNSQSGLVRLGTGSETSESQWPHHIIFDRSYIHGVARKNNTRGIYANGTDWAVIDSYLSEFHHTGADSQAILMGQGRRAAMVNNYLEGAGENFMVGGVDHTVLPVTTPSDITFTRNYVPWKQSWKSNDPSWEGIDWVTKNHWESKTGKRILVFGNIFDKWWSSEQTGGSIAIKSSDNDKDPSVVSRDIVWYRNWHKNLGSGISINGSKWPDEESFDWTQNVWFIHSLFEINGDVWDDENTGNSSEATVTRIGVSVVAPTFRFQYPDSLRLVHNTFTNANAAQSSRQIHALAEIPSTEGKAENLVVQNNILGYGIFGIKCDGTAEGNASLNATTNSVTRTWATNLIAGSSTNYPTGNTYVANFTAVKFVNFNNGLDGNYRLAGDSPGKNAASDGTDMGADIDAVERATQYVTTGNWQSGATVCRWSTSPACQ